MSPLPVARRATAMLLALLVAGCPKPAAVAQRPAGDVWLDAGPSEPAVCVPALAQEPPLGARERASWWDGLDALRAGDPLTAQGHFTRAGTHPVVSGARVATSLLFGDGDRAAVRVAPMVERFPDDPCLLHTAALAARQAGDPALGFERAARAASLAPEQPDIAFAYALIAAEHDPDTGWKTAEDMAARFPDHPGAFQVQATVALAKGDLEAAIPPLQQMLALGTPVEGMLLTAYRMTGRLGDALVLHAKRGDRLGDGGAIAAADDPTAAFYDTLGIRPDQRLAATIRTSVGTLRCTLLPDLAPLTVLNFVGLTRGTIAWTDPSGVERTDPLYPGTTFHRVIPGFMVQGGDPKGDGSGGPGYQFPDEIDQRIRFDRPGILAMANSGPNTNGSQFFVTEAPTPHLDGLHTIFGHCDEASQRLVTTMTRSPRGEADRPNTPITIEAITLEGRDVLPSALSAP